MWEYKGIPANNDYLAHYKYLTRKTGKDGKWVYTYASSNPVKKNLKSKISDKLNSIPTRTLKVSFENNKDPNKRDVEEESYNRKGELLGHKKYTEVVTTKRVSTGKKLVDKILGGGRKVTTTNRVGGYDEFIDSRFGQSVGVPLDSDKKSGRSAR